MAYAPGPHAPRRTGPAPPRRTEPATRAPSPASPPPPRRSAHSAVRPPPSAAPAPAAPRDTPPSSTAPAPPTSPADPARSAKHRQLDSSNKPTASTAVYLADTPLGGSPMPRTERSRERIGAVFLPEADAIEVADDFTPG